MTEYRIVEEYRDIWIEKKTSNGMWLIVDIKGVPKYHATVADARSWVATIKRGTVYHGAEKVGGLRGAVDFLENNPRYFENAMSDHRTDAPNIAQDERRAEIGVKVSDEWEQAITSHIATLLRERGLVNGIQIYNVTVDDKHIRIYT